MAATGDASSELAVALFSFFGALASSCYPEICNPLLIGLLRQ